MNLYALIKNSRVVNMIESDPAGIVGITGYDAIIDVTTIIPAPAIGWSYNGVNFVNPVPDDPSIGLKSIARKEASDRLKSLPDNVPANNLPAALKDILIYLGLK